MNHGDTAWVLIATALVMLMTPAGLALFYGGMSNKKNVINTVGMSYIAYCVAIIVWVVAGYSIAFSGGNNFIGSLDKVMLHRIGINEIQGTIPELLFVAFQSVFAAIAVAIISGSVIERIKFSTWIIFSALWVLLVYSPLVHWIWGDGWLKDIGELDFAGGTVIHVNAGIAGLVLSLMLGKRKSYHRKEKPSSVKLTIIGSALLWFGWFGFNAGSQLAADGVAANALLVTNISACAGGITWLLIEWAAKSTPTLLGAASGVIAALVGITPCAGYVDAGDSLVIGISSGIVGYFGTVKLKAIFKYDDSLDAFGIHGLVGIWGSIAAGLFANPAINTAAGAFYGNPSQLLTQLEALAATIIYSALATYILFKITSWITNGARIKDHHEIQGMDEALHKETSFSFDIKSTNH